MPQITGAHAALKHLFDDFVLFRPNKKGVMPIPYHWVPEKKSNLVVITGDNASGKSLTRRLLSQIYNTAKIEPMAISMQGRTSGGMMSAFVYGAEDYESTGQISARTVTSGISTCRKREKPHMVFWDEPDLGLSDGWAAGVGVMIGKFAKSLPELTKGVFVVTHSKALVSQLLSVPHHYVHFGDGDHPPTLADWCKAPVTPLPIDTLGDLSRRRFRLIQDAFAANK